MNAWRIFYLCSGQGQEQFGAFTVSSHQHMAQHAVLAQRIPSDRAAWRRQTHQMSECPRVKDIPPDGCPVSVWTWGCSHRCTVIPCWFWALCIDISLSPSPSSAFHNGWQWWWAAMQISLQIPRAVLRAVHDRRQDRRIPMVWDHWGLRQRQEIRLLSRDWYEQCLPGHGFNKCPSAHFHQSTRKSMS